MIAHVGAWLVGRGAVPPDLHVDVPDLEAALLHPARPARPTPRGGLTMSTRPPDPRPTRRPPRRPDAATPRPTRRLITTELRLLLRDPLT